MGDSLEYGRKIEKMKIAAHTPSLALFTDFYELTMAYAYWQQKMAEDEAVFHLFFRKLPFQGGYAVACGLESVINYLQNWRFYKEDLDYLASLPGYSFDEKFLRYLEELRFSCDLFAMPEGDVAFPYEPLLRVEGPILQAQLLESALVNLVNFPTLIATKAARCVYAAQGDPVIEFGMRRAQGIDGAITATRASYVGGCAGTSNTWAGKEFGIPVRGTHAHSWVMAFESEFASFQAYAEALPDHCIFLVDTYDTLEGVRNAIEVGKWLRERGRPLIGIRLDSGDIAYLSIESRKLLDQAGFHDTRIMASNELDERIIADLKAQGAQVAIWGVGTSLVTGRGQAALDCVYKISAFRKRGESDWHYKLKFAERMSKTSDPGVLQVCRFRDPRLGFVADAIYDIHSPIKEQCSIIDPFDPIRTKELGPHLIREDMLKPIFHKGKLVYPLPALTESRLFAQQRLALFDKSIKRFCNPHSYPVGMEKSLYKKKLEIVEEIKKQRHARPDHC